MRSAPLLALVLAALLLLAAPAGAQGLSASTVEPRAFGYYVGDRIQRQVTIEVPDGLTLDEASLPRPGARGQPLELQQLQRESSEGGRRLQLQLSYQLFKSPLQTQTLEIAPIILHFKGQPRAQDLRIEAWPVTVSPLVPAEAPTRVGLGELRPDQPPLLLDTALVRQRLVVEVALALLLAAYLAQVYLVLPWWKRRSRPFGLAWQHLRGLPADAGSVRAAFQHLHAALNQTAGEVLFVQGLERFLAERPRYRALRTELLDFFERSRTEFFGAQGPQPAPAQQPWLLELCRKCRDAERGAA